MDSTTISMVSACTALVASIAGPIVTLAVARKQFSASVLSANRQKWVESFRDLLAELVSQIVAVVFVKKGHHESWDMDVEAASTNPDVLKRIERLALLFWKIRLLLNPNKQPHQELCAAIEAVLEKLKKHEVNQTEIRASVEQITQLAQTILSQEWERVKRGV